MTRREPSAKTKTLPEAIRGAVYDGPDAPTALQVYDTDLTLELPRDKRSFTLGSSPDDSDVSIRDEYISKVHCLVERRGPGLRIHDQQSYNGTFFDNTKVEVFDARPGDTFVLGRVRMLVMNAEMQAALPVLTDILGAPDERSLRPSSMGGSTPCDLILAAKGGAHILILGDHDCDQERLAATIHGISLRRNRELVFLDREPQARADQRGVIDRASRSTLVLMIEDETPVMDATFVSMLFDPRYHVRVIAIAPSAAKLRNVIGEANVSTMRQVTLLSLAQRPGSVPRLLDRLLGERATKLRVSDMTPSNQAALMAYGWPKNLTTLRTAADRLAGIARSPSLNAAAQVLGMSTSSLQNWYVDQLGLSWPLVAGAESDGKDRGGRRRKERG